MDRALRLEENGLPVQVMGHTLLADARGRDRLTSDPVILLGLELGCDPPMERLARSLLGAQASRYRKTGRVTMAAEDSISRPPHFFYYYSVYTHRKAFAVDVQDPMRSSTSRGGSAPRPRSPGMRCCRDPIPGSRHRLSSPRTPPPAGDPGVYEGSATCPTGALNLNTAAVILTAALVDRRGQPVFEAAGGVRRN